MPVGEFIVSGENEPLVALGMTGASFEGAQKAGITRIEADTDAMKYIAQRIGYTALPSLLLIARDSSPERKWKKHWDDRLPAKQGSPDTGRFFFADDLGVEEPVPANREIFVEAARDIGARALTEISIPDWGNNATHPGDFATGLLLGRRPLDLPPGPSLRRMVSHVVEKPPLDMVKSLVGAPKRFVVSTVVSTIRDQRAVNAIHAIRADPAMPKPFIITKNNRPELEEGPSV